MCNTHLNSLSTLANIRLTTKKKLMKKITLLTMIMLLTCFYVLKAQINNTTSTQKLTHQMSEEEKLLFKQYQSKLVASAGPTKPVRNIAEFEPTEAAIIAYPGQFGIPLSLIKDLSNDGKLIVITSSSDKASATSAMQSGGVNMANVQYLIATVDSYWARDYTGWFIADGNNKVGIVDFKYDRPRANDDAIPIKQGTFLNETVYSMPLTHTGGNYMCDGMGKATSTDLVWDENSISHAQIDQNMLDYLGINNYMVVNDAQGEYIKHIDCWGKFLAVDKILIDSVPSSDPRFSAYQAAAAYYANTNCSYGYKYKVIRPYCAGSKAGGYSNSFICNDKVYIALKGTSYDAAAINVYKKAMPGYTVRGYLGASATPWEATDALHCRVHEIADRGMLYINHVPLHDKVCSTTGYKISINAVSYSGTAMKAGYPMVKYRLNAGAWDSIPMVLSTANNYDATIPNQSNGVVVDYYIKAIDASNKLANHPFIGAPDPHKFTAYCNNTGIDEITFETNFSTYPNPSNGNFYVYLDSKKNCTARIKIMNLLGQAVFNESFDLNSGISLKNINLSEINKGVYFIEYKTDRETITKQIVIN